MAIIRKHISNYEAYSQIPYGDVIAGLPVAGWVLEQIGTSQEWDDEGSPGITYPIYAMHYGDLVNKPTIMVSSAIHGEEWEAVFFNRDFCNFITNQYSQLPYKDAKFVEKILDKFSIYLIVCLNPYGYETSRLGERGRTNSRGVDLNRNFDHNWATYDDSENTGTKGASPFSEAESLLIKNLVETIKPSVYLDWHSAGSATNIHFFAANENTFDVWKYLDSDIRLSIQLGLNYLSGIAWQCPLSYANTEPTAAAWVSSQLDKSDHPIWATMPESSGALSTEIQHRQGTFVNYMAMIYGYHYFINRNNTGKIFDKKNKRRKLKGFF